MSAQAEYIALGNNKIHYLKMGAGKHMLLAFHGYGNTASLFFPFQSYLEKDFTIISIDLPHHGKTQWEKNVLFRKNDLGQLAAILMEQNNAEKISLLGYSMGGRVCLCLMEMMPEKIEQALLIASDGLVFNPLYFFVTKTFLGKKIFRNFLVHPKRYMKWVDTMRDRNWIDASRHKFASHYLGSERDRMLLLHVWSDLSLIVPSMKKLRAAIHAHNIPVSVFMGMHDRVIPVSHAKRFQKGLPSVRLFALNKGHRLIDSETLPQMADCLIKGIVQS